MGTQRNSFCTPCQEWRCFRQRIGLRHAINTPAARKRTAGAVLFLKAVLQTNAPVEYQPPGRTVLAVQTEIPYPHELEVCGRFCLGQSGFHLAAVHYLQRGFIHAVEEVLIRRIWGSIAEQVVIEPALCVHGCSGVHPMDGGAFDLPAVRRVPSPALRVIRRQNLNDIPLCVLFAAGTFNEVRALQTAFRPIGKQPFILWHRDFQEVVRFHIDFPGKGNGPGSVLRLLVLGF